MGNIPRAAADFIIKALGDNIAHMRFDDAQLEISQRDQKPAATVLMCSDSRVQRSAFARTDAYGLFMVRNIGNQLITSIGSVTYGVRVLNTPVLLVMAHSVCGAVQASLDGYEDAPSCVKKELKTVQLACAKTLNEGIINNLNYQVEYAVNTFHDKVGDGSLTVVGGVYDFRNDFGEGAGRLIITNINCDRDSDRLAEAVGRFGEVKYKFGLSEHK